MEGKAEKEEGAGKVNCEEDGESRERRQTRESVGVSEAEMC